MSDAPALFAKHQHLARGWERDWFLPGGDADDIRQEARIALWEAARCYDTTLGVPFTAFARLVIERRLRDALRTARTPKHMMLSDSDREHDASTDHAETLERRAELRALVDACNQLSLLEQQAVGAVVRGEPYAHSKTADNALQRARRKLRATTSV